VIKKLTPLKFQHRWSHRNPQNATQSLAQKHIILTWCICCWDGLPIFGQLTLYPSPKVLCFTLFFNQPEIPKSAHSCGGIYTPCNTCSLDPPDWASQTVSWSIQPFLHSSRQKVHILYNVHENAINTQLVLFQLILPSVLWRCWLGSRKGIQPVKKLSGKVLAWLSVWSEVQMICIWSSWCHCHPVISCSSRIQNGLPFWC